MGAVPRLFIAVAGSVVAAWAGYEAVRLGVAGIAAENASRELSRPMREGVVLAGSWWHGDVARTAREVPNDPTVREVNALVIARSTNDPGELAQVQQELVAAIEARPGSGYTWANLAELKYRMGDTGPVFEKALAHAVALAPYEPEVQGTVAEYGLAVIDEVGPQARAAIERAVAAAMKRNATETLQIAARRGRLGVACRHLDGVPRPAASKWTQLCQSMEATS